MVLALLRVTPGILSSTQNLGHVSALQVLSVQLPRVMRPRDVSLSPRHSPLVVHSYLYAGFSGARTTEDVHGLADDTNEHQQSIRLTHSRNMRSSHLGISCVGKQGMSVDGVPSGK